MSDIKLAVKKLGIVGKYINFQLSIDAISKPVASEIKRFVKEAVDCLHETNGAETETEAKIS